MRKFAIIGLILMMGLLSSCGSPDDLFTAIQKGDLNAVRNMADVHRDWVNYQKANGEAPMHEAAYSGNVDMLEALVARGADINIKKSGGFTPLHIAAQRGNAAAVKYLLKQRAVISEDEVGLTPAEVARKAGYEDVAKMFPK